MCVAFVQDLFFAAKIQDIAKAGGYSLQVAGSPEELAQILGRVTPRHVLLDLTLVNEEILALVKGVPRVAGFGPHVDRERFASARAGGIRTMWANSALADRLLAWLAE